MEEIEKLAGEVYLTSEEYQENLDDPFMQGTAEQMGFPNVHELLLSNFITPRITEKDFGEGELETKAAECRLSVREYLGNLNFKMVIARAKENEKTPHEWIKECEDYKQLLREQEVAREEAKRKKLEKEGRTHYFCLRDSNLEVIRGWYAITAETRNMLIADYAKNHTKPFYMQGVFDYVAE